MPRSHPPEPRAPRSRKRFGQHFLVDTGVIDDIVALIAPQPEDRILEIGPGGGALTEHLVASGARVEAIEIDRDLAAELAGRFAAAGNFALHNEDVLDFDLTALGPQDGHWKVAGNLPYNISTPLIVRLLEHAALFSEMTLMVQREVAARLSAVPGAKSWGRLGIVAQRRARVALRLDVPAQSFSPPPRVESAVVQLRPLPGPYDAALEATVSDLVRAAFGARRKTIGNALRRQVSRTLLADCGIDPAARAEALSVEDFVRLAAAVRGSRTAAD